MKKRSFSLQRSAVLLTAILLAVSAGACGAEDTHSETAANAGESAGTQSESKDSQNAASAEDGTDGENESDKNSDIDVTNNPSGAEENTSSKITVTFQETLDEIKADDGTVILRNDVQIPVVSIEGAEDIEEKLNAEITAYYEYFSIYETISMP